MLFISNLNPLPFKEIDSIIQHRGYGDPVYGSVPKDLLFIRSSEPRNNSTRRWNVLGSVNEVWLNLFKKRWGDDRVSFYMPSESSKTWKVVYEAQDRCDRVGLGMKIIREGSDYYLVNQGQIQLHLGSNHYKSAALGLPILNRHSEDEPRLGILDKILFFVGDLETASTCAKRRRRDT